MHIKIGAFNYEILEESDLHEMSGEEREEYFGLQSSMNLTLRLEQDMQPDTKIVTLWHEIFHCVLHNAGHRSHPEEVMDALASGIVEVLRDNPQMIEWTLEGYEDPVWIGLSEMQLESSLEVS